MDSLHPPYNIVQPRLLNRWLDVNTQNGPLKRTQKFITIPSFDIAHNWNGYSEIVAAFDYNSPNNFSIKSITGIIDGNFVLCISYVNKDNSVVRYRLNAVDGTFYFDIPEYNGQMIKKNFRVEVWNINADNSTLASDATVYTSVRGVLDYRYGSDDTLCDGVVKNTFGYDILPNTIFNLGNYVSGGVVAISGEFKEPNLLVGGLYTFAVGNGNYLLAPDITKTYDGQTFYGKAGYIYVCIANVALANQPCTSTITSTLNYLLPLTFPNSPTINN